MEVEWIEDEARFRELEPEWDALAELERSPFLRHSWFRSWWEVYGRGRRLRIAALRDDGALAALLPLWVDGRRADSMADSITPAFKPFGRDRESVRAVIDAALGTQSVGELQLRSVPADGVERLVADRASARRWLVHRTHVRRSPFVDTRGSLDEYVHGLDPDFRQSIGRRRRKLEREHAVEYDVWRRPTALEDELQQALELEAKGWKGSRGDAILKSRTRTDLYRRVAGAFHEQGRLLIGRIDVDGELAMVAISLLDGNRLWMLDGGYDERYRRYGLGILLNMLAIEECFARGVESCELLGDRASWKRHFATGETPYDVYRLYRLRPAPVARFAVRRFVREPLRLAYLHPRLAGLRRRLTGS